MMSTQHKIMSRINANPIKISAGVFAHIVSRMNVGDTKVMNNHNNFEE